MIWALYIYFDRVEYWECVLQGHEYDLVQHWRERYVNGGYKHTMVWPVDMAFPFEGRGGWGK